jgi:hypothetical protein
MTWWALIIPAIPGVLALIWQGAWQIVTWRHRHEDARRLESMKGDIQRDVTATLQAQESRLRVASELQLRMNDRSVQLLRDIMTAAFDAHQTVLDFAFAALPDDPNVASREEAHRRATVAVVKLQTLVTAAPPDERESLTQMSAAMTSAANSTTAMAFSREGMRGRAQTLAEIRAELDEGLVEGGLAFKRWNAKLWEASEEMPRAIVKG